MELRQSLRTSHSLKQQFTGKISSSATPTLKALSLLPILIRSQLCSVDGQGRLLLPQQLREFAGIQKDVWVTGVQDRVEIWDIDEWNKAQDALTNDDVKSLMDQIGF